MRRALVAFAAIATLAGAASARADTYTHWNNTSGTFSDPDVTAAGFNDSYAFDTTVSGLFDVSLSTSSPGIDFTSLTFDNQALTYAGSLGSSRFWSLSNVKVTSGAQTIVATGTYTTTDGMTTGAYDGTVTFRAVSAAPEPATWALMFAGVAGIGLAFRQARRKYGFRFKDAFAA